jgi:nicotinate dehydrogenase subunit A
MDEDVALDVNGQGRRVRCDPSTPLLYILRNDLGLPGAKFGCGLEQCGACKVLVDGKALPTCRRSSRLSSTRKPRNAATAFRA